jgi:hypothetical protein
VEDAENAALRALAVADPRFARRLAAPPAADELRHAVVEALAQGDPDVSARDGSLDFFSFTARGRAIGRAKAALDAAGPAGPEADLGWDLVRRIVGEEESRLAEERTLPTGAAALVRGIVDTWSPPSADGRPARDAWLAGRLALLRESLRPQSLTRSAAAALDGALDPIERFAPPEDLPASAKELARLRVALDGATASAPGTGDGSAIASSVRAHLGVEGDVGELRARLLRAEEGTRRLAKEAAAGIDDRALSRAADGLLFVEGRCDGPGAPPVRALAPSAERAPICGIVRALRDAKDGPARAAAIVALHDEAVVGLWSLALHVDGLPANRAAATHHVFFGAEPDREARLLRYAESRPVASIGAALAAEMLTRPSPASAGDAWARSARWLSLGDLPLDVVERTLLSDAPPPPASPRP